MKKFYIRKSGKTWFALDGIKFDKTIGLNPEWVAGWTVVYGADEEAALAVGQTIDYFNVQGLYDREAA